MMHGQLLQGGCHIMPVQSMHGPCLPLSPAAIPHGGIHAQSITVVLLGAAMARGRFVPEHCAVFGLVLADLVVNI